ncbi:hypothetical protein MRX96_030407 [Rhipicephalus microplus]
MAQSRPRSLRRWSAQIVDEPSASSQARDEPDKPVFLKVDLLQPGLLPTVNSSRVPPHDSRGGISGSRWLHQPFNTRASPLAATSPRVTAPNTSLSEGSALQPDVGGAA